MSIHDRRRQPSLKDRLQAVTQWLHVVLVGGNAHVCLCCCRSKTDNSGHIFSPCPPSILVPSAVDQRFKHHTLSRVECTNTLRCAKLVTDHRQEIDPKILNTDG